MSRRAPRLAAQGQYSEAVASALLNPWAPFCGEILAKYGHSSPLADLAARDQDRLLLSREQVDRISKVLASDCLTDGAERNVLTACRHAQSIHLSTLQLVTTGLCSLEIDQLVVDMIHTGMLPGAEVDQVAGTVFLPDTHLGPDPVFRELDSLVADIEKKES